MPSPAPGWYLASAEAHGRDASRVAFDLDEDITNVVLTFSNRGSQIKGVVRGSLMTASDDAAIAVFPARPMQGAQVVLMEKQTDGGTLRRPASFARINWTTDDEGRYRVYGLPPGDYVE